jgi:hypothetical protein
MWLRTVSLLTWSIRAICSVDRAFPEHLQHLILACRQLRHPRRGSRLAGQHDSEDRVAFVPVLDRHRADLGAPAATVGGEDVHLVVGDRSASELSLQLPLDERDVLGCNDRREWTAREIAEHLLGRLVPPGERPVARGDEARNLYLLECPGELDRPLLLHLRRFCADSAPGSTPVARMQFDPAVS